MAEVHDRIGAARKTAPGDPIPQVAAGIAAKTALLCFDELHVTDIADAMILGRLFKGLFEQQVVVVATSNVPPRDLYRNGLNRQLFVPFIDLIEEHMEVEELLAAQGLPPGEARRQAALLHARRCPGQGADGPAVGRADRQQPGAPIDLEVKGRTLRGAAGGHGRGTLHVRGAVRAAAGNARLPGSRAQVPHLLIDGIPVLAPAQRDVARRFVNLIDTLYDSRVGLVASAAAEPDGLYPAGDVQFLFERTASRLIEMRSEGYLAARAERLADPVPA